MYNWIDEYHQGSRYGLEGEILIEQKSDYQKITIVQSNQYGKALLLDDCWMTAEYQEKSYHECLVHPALSSSSNIQKILIIGGGDGGTARECLRYKEVKEIDMIEIDQEVINLCKQYLPSIGNNAWSDPRLKVRVEDGIHWAKNTKTNSYDVVIVDGSDPAGPAKGLFNKSFFEDCRRILKPGGIFATQSESPAAFRDVHLDIVKLMRKIFTYADPLYGWVPIYPSGWWSWSFAAMDSPYYKNPLIERTQSISTELEVWTPKWQRASFDAIPAFIERELQQEI